MRYLKGASLESRRLVKRGVTAVVAKGLAHIHEAAPCHYDPRLHCEAWIDCPCLKGKHPD